MRLLVDNQDEPNLYLIDCHLKKDYLQVNLGFISMGRSDRDYPLFDTHNNLVCTVKLPPSAVRLSTDVTCILSEEQFFYVE